MHSHFESAAQVRLTSLWFHLNTPVFSQKRGSNLWRDYTCKEVVHKTWRCFCCSLIPTWLIVMTIKHQVHSNRAKNTPENRLFRVEHYTCVWALFSFYSKIANPFFSFFIQFLKTELEYNNDNKHYYYYSNPNQLFRLWHAFGKQLSLLHLLDMERTSSRITMQTLCRKATRRG